MAKHSEHDGPRIDRHHAQHGYIRLFDGTVAKLATIDHETFMSFVRGCLLSAETQERCWNRIKTLDDGHFDDLSKWCMLNVLLEHGATVPFFKSKEEIVA